MFIMFVSPLPSHKREKQTVNEQIIAASAPVIRHLVAIVVLAAELNVPFQAMYLSLDILINVASKIDLSGKRRLHGYYFPEDLMSENNDEIQRNLQLLRASSHMNSTSYYDYVAAVSSLMSVLTLVVSGNALVNRTIAMRSLELITRIALNPDNTVYLSNSPDLFVYSLIEILCCSKTNLEPWVPDIFTLHGDAEGRRRPPACVKVRDMVPIDAVPPKINSSTAALMQHITFNGVQLTIPKDQFVANMSEDDPLSMDTNDDLLNIASSAPSYMAGGNDRSVTDKLSTVEKPSVMDGIIKDAIASFFVDSSDVEIRDLALEALLSLCTGSIPFQYRVIQVPRVFDVLLRIAVSGSSLTNPSGSSVSFVGIVNNVPNIPMSLPSVPTYSHGTALSTSQRSEGCVKALQVRK